MGTHQLEFLMEPLPAGELDVKPIFPMHKATETCIFLTSHEISVGVIGLHNDNAKGGGGRGGGGRGCGSGKDDSR